jgi:hypothetical protein
MLASVWEEQTGGQVGKTLSAKNISDIRVFNIIVGCKRSRNKPCPENDIMSSNEAGEEHKEAVFIGQECAPGNLPLTLLSFLCW